MAHGQIHTSFLIAPLIIGLMFLLFATFTEYWTQLDYELLARNNALTSAPHANWTSQRRNYLIKRLRIQVPKYSSLFGACDEYTYVNIWQPIRLSGGGGRMSLPFLSPSFNATSPHTDTDDDAAAEQCLTRETCPGICTCCFKRQSSCCYLSLDKCQSYTEKKDEEKVLQPFSAKTTTYYDESSKCTRHSYDPFQLFAQADPYALNESNNETRPTHVLRKFVDMLHSSKYTEQIFAYRALVALCFAICALFTTLALLVTVIAVCCNPTATATSGDSQANYAGYDQDEYDYDNDVNDDDDIECRHGHATSLGARCHRCVCVSFGLFTVFMLVTVAACFLAICLYIYSLYLVRNSFVTTTITTTTSTTTTTATANGLTDLSDYAIETMSAANGVGEDSIAAAATAAAIEVYQYNSWLLDLIKFGLSFYATLVAFLMYLFVFFLSTCITCRIHASKAHMAHAHASASLSSRIRVNYQKLNVDKKSPPSDAIDAVAASSSSSSSAAKASNHKNNNNNKCQILVVSNTTTTNESGGGGNNSNSNSSSKSNLIKNRSLLTPDKGGDKCAIAECDDDEFEDENYDEFSSI